MSYMKLFDSYNPSSVLSCLMLVAATPAIAYPSVTQICTEVGVELKKGIKEARLQQQELDRMMLRCRDDWGVIVKPM